LGLCLGFARNGLLRGLRHSARKCTTYAHVLQKSPTGSPHFVEACCTFMPLTLPSQTLTRNKSYGIPPNWGGLLYTCVMTVSCTWGVAGGVPHHHGHTLPTAPPFPHQAFHTRLCFGCSCWEALFGWWHKCEYILVVSCMPRWSRCWLFWPEQLLSLFASPMVRHGDS